ncbi:MAG: hypothetical protein JNJ43_18735 [Anaerolineales bacterium]|nr:hypothetical protein [Anaerolineales bacterium]
MFIQVVYDAKEDMEIPTQGLTFGTLIRAQALGDYEALIAAGRKAVRIRLSSFDELKRTAANFTNSHGFLIISENSRNSWQKVFRQNDKHPCFWKMYRLPKR